MLHHVYHHAHSSSLSRATRHAAEQKNAMSKPVLHRIENAVQFYSSPQHIDSRKTVYGDMVVIQLSTIGTLGLARLNRTFSPTCQQKGSTTLIQISTVGTLSMPTLNAARTCGKNVYGDQVVIQISTIGTLGMPTLNAARTCGKNVYGDQVVIQPSTIGTHGLPTLDVSFWPTCQQKGSVTLIQISTVGTLSMARLNRAFLAQLKEPFFTTLSVIALSMLSFYVFYCFRIDFREDILVYF